MSGKIDTQLDNDGAANRLALIKRVSKLMDEEFTVGKFKFGLDPILNLIPGAGDLAAYIISSVLLITIIGALPLLGWVFDFVFKANKRNVQLLQEHYTQGKHAGSAKPYLLVIALILILVVIILIILSIWILRLLAGYFNTTVF